MKKNFKKPKYMRNERNLREVKNLQRKFTRKDDSAKITEVNLNT